MCDIYINYEFIIQRWIMVQIDINITLPHTSNGIWTFMYTRVQTNLYIQTWELKTFLTKNL